MRKLLLPVMFASVFNLTPVFSQVPKEAFTFDYNVKTIKMSRDKEEKIHRALELIRHVLSTEEFRKGILKHKFNGKRRFANNRGLTNYQIYKRILSGAEMLHPYANNAMDLEVQLYTDLKTNTVGYTWPSSFRIWMNTKYFNERTPAKIAGTIVHEWLHKLGFGHEYFVCANRKYSVPYAVGKLIHELALGFEEEY